MRLNCPGSCATNRFLSQNNLDYNCTNLKVVNTVCMGLAARYTRSRLAIRDSILLHQAFYPTQFLSWNPSVVEIEIESPLRC